ncbi:MAG: hypothetical protein K2Z81_01655 [Cyanobacteria bacterium]|nr:hypothetical protein [Cyanobacteriota bacterium]
MTKRNSHNAFSAMGSNGNNGGNGNGHHGNHGTTAPNNQDLLSQIVNNAVLSVISPVELEQHEIYICECGNCHQDKGGTNESDDLSVEPQMPLYFIERRANGGTLLLDETDVSHNTVVAGSEKRRAIEPESPSEDQDDSFVDDFDPFDPRVSQSDIDKANAANQDLDLDLD